MRNPYQQFDEYGLRHIVMHLIDLEQSELVTEFLTDFDFLQTKVNLLGPESLISDYDPVKSNDALKSIQGALQLSAHVLVEDKTQLAGHLLGRLLSHEASAIKKLLKEIKQRKNVSWLRPLSPGLLSPDQPLLRTLIGHTGAINTVAVAKIVDDRHIIISGSEDKTLKIWDLESGKCLYTLTGHTSDINAVAVTPDARRAVSGTGHKIKIWDLKNRECIHTLDDYRPGPCEVGISGPKPTVAITADGRRAVSSSAELIKVWDLESGQCLHALAGHIDIITAIAATPDGRLAVSGSHDRTLRVWDLNKGTSLWTLKMPKFSENRHIRHIGDPLLDDRQASLRITNIAHLTPDGSRTIACLEVPWVIVLDLENRCILYAWYLLRKLCGLTVLPDGVHALSYSGPTLTMNENQTFWFWNLETGEILNNFVENIYSIRAIAVTPDGQYAVSASRNVLNVWDLRRKSIGYAPASHTKEVSTVVVTPDGRHAISASGASWSTEIAMKALNIHSGQYGNVSSDNSVKVWNVENGKCLHTLTGHTARVLSLAITPNQHFILSNSNDGTIRIWDLESGNCQYTLQTSGDIMALTLDGRHVIYNSERGELKVWNIENNMDEFTLVGHSHKVNHLIIVPDGYRVISASEDTSLKIWDLRSGKCLRTLSGHSTWLKEALVTPDGRYLISISYDDYPVRVWDLKKYKCLPALKNHKGSVGSMAVMPDGAHVITGSDDNTVKIWEVATGRLVQSLEGHSDSVSLVVVTPDGRYAISQSDDNIINIWNLTTFLEEYTLAGKWVTASYSEGVVHGLSANEYYYSITPDANRIIYALDSSTLDVWDLKNRLSVGRFTVESQLSTCAVTPDGLTIVVGDALGQVHFLHMENTVSNAPIVTARWLKPRRQWRFRQRQREQQVVFSCPHCQMDQTVAASTLGRELLCPNCEDAVKLNPFAIKGVD